MMVLDRAGRALVLVLAAVVAPAALALSCAPDLRVVNGTGGAPGTTSTGGAATGGAGPGTGGSSTTGTGGAPDAGHDAASDASDAGGDAGGDAGNDAAGDASDAGSADASDAGSADAADAADSSCSFSDTNPLNCGRCGHSCCGSTCVGGVCQPSIISQGSSPGVPAVDPSYIYWPDAQNTADGGIMRAPKDGGAAVALTPGQNNPFAVAVDSTSVYWVTYSNNPPSYGGVFSAPVGGGAVVPLVPTGESWANAILVNGAGIFWDDYASNQIRTAGLDGSAPTTLAGSAVGVDTPQQMAIDGQYVYWSNRFAFTIQKAPLGGGGLVNLATGQDPVAVAVNSVNVYWANYSTGTIQKAPLAGGAASVVATSGGDGAWSIATDGTNVYWGVKGATTDGGAGGSIRSAPVDGTGALGTVLAQSPNPLYVTIDANCVYWADNKNGNIGLVAKP